MAVGIDDNRRKFIETEPIGKAGAEAEEQVWIACKRAFSDRECIGYWRYPIFSSTGEQRKEPDLLFIDRELGVVTIEVKGLRIDQITAVDGHRWSYQNFYEAYGSPYEQAETHLYALLAYCDRETLIRRSVRGRALVALPHITEAEWQDRGFDRLPHCPPILFKDHLGPKTLLARISNLTPVESGKNLSDDQWELLLSVVGGSQVMRKPRAATQPIAQSTGSRVEVINKLRERLYEIDLQQSHIGLEIPPGIQRIRGIAGSGKTVLLCQKAANMHLKHPDWDIALVFFTRSLYDQIESLVDRWLLHFSTGSVGYKNNAHAQAKLKIFHAWGAKDRPGFYRYVSKENDIPPLAVRDTEYRQPNEGLADICKRLLEKKGSLKQTFDAVLIDEGQDLVVDPDELKFEERQAIYWLAYQSLRPCDSDNPLQRRLIWAYDEAQSLDTQKIPSASELFGNDASFNQLLRWRYKGGIKPSEIMHRCYRTPGPILTAAHAIGMGLLRPDGMLSGLTVKEDWENIGYQVEGKFIANESVTLHRPPKNSPNPIPDLSLDPVLQLSLYESRQQELEALAANIRHNLEVDRLEPSRQILVIVLGTTFEAMNLEVQVAKFLLDQGINIFIPTGTRLNQLKPKYPDNDPDTFWYPGGVTVSRIARAKGNEAEMIYVVGLDNVAKSEEDIQLRNQLFVGLTRSRGWAVMTGTGYYPMYDEIQAVLDSKDTFKFVYRRPPKRDIKDLEQLSEDEDV